MSKFYVSKKVTSSAVLVIISVSFLFYAYSAGITGRTLKNGTGCTCHSQTPSSNVTVSISGPDSLQYNQTGTYTVTIAGGPLTRGGTNIAASEGAVNIITSDLQKIGDELTHTSPKAPSGGTVTFSFNYTAPATAGARTLYANGNSVNFNGNNGGDEWNFAANKTVVVVPIIPVELSYFTAEVKGSVVELNWSTATEKNNYGFEVLRSAGKDDWLKAGFVEGKGTTTDPSKYEFKDRNLRPGKYYYKLRQVDYDGQFRLYDLGSEVSISAPENFVLLQNYPNPFNPSTTIEFDLDKQENVSLKIYNALGKEVAVLVNSVLPAGKHRAQFNTRDMNNVASGIYFYELTAGSNKAVKKMILNK